MHDPAAHLGGAVGEQPRVMRARALVDTCYAIADFRETELTYMCESGSTSLPQQALHVGLPASVKVEHGNRH